MKIAQHIWYCMTCMQIDRRNIFLLNVPIFISVINTDLKYTLQACILKICKIFFLSLLYNQQQTVKNISYGREDTYIKTDDGIPKENQRDDRQPSTVNVTG